jgi:gamma-glutamyl:cysteine ligase YbdK (ATP-grasp superfamily)
MGQEVEHPPRFHKADYTRFHKALVAETELARQYARRQGFASKQQATVGMELEVSLVDAAQLRPACISRELLVYLQAQKDQSTAAAAADEAKDSKGNDGSGLTDELGQFQLEYNSPVFTLTGNCLRQMQDDLQSFWDRTDAAVGHFDAHLLAIGTLPTLRSDDLGLSSMSDRNRYRALNEQLLCQRHGRPIHLDIHCLQENVSKPTPDSSSFSSTPSSPSSLTLDHYNCMLEAICCSFQLHWQVPCQQSARYFNAGLLVSPILVAVTANSPIVLGRLTSWQESRIPIFEQAYEVQPRRVWLGNGFVRDSVVEVFEENLDIPAILPEYCTETPRDQFRHLKLHNGSVWRWHRPLIGTNGTSTSTVDAGGDSSDSSASEKERVHLRIEHRTIPAGPTVVDSIANAAFYYGMVEELANLPVSPESMCNFETVETNFYQAAERGLEAEIEWLCSDDHNPTNIQNVVLERLLPAARRGLERLDIDASDAEYYLGIIERRVKTGQTGAVWQRRWIAKYGQLDTQALTSTYWKQQRTGRPCSEWDV